MHCAYFITKDQKIFFSLVKPRSVLLPNSQTIDFLTQLKCIFTPQSLASRKDIKGEQKCKEKNCQKTKAIKRQRDTPFAPIAPSENRNNNNEMLWKQRHFCRQGIHVYFVFFSFSLHLRFLTEYVFKIFFICFVCFVQKLTRYRFGLLLEGYSFLLALCASFFPRKIISIVITGSASANCLNVIQKNSSLTVKRYYRFICLNRKRQSLIDDKMEKTLAQVDLSAECDEFK